MLGGLAVLCLAAIIFFWRRRRRHTLRAAELAGPPAAAELAAAHGHYRPPEAGQAYGGWDGYAAKAELDPNATPPAELPHETRRAEMQG